MKKKTINYNDVFKLPPGSHDVIVYRENRKGGFEPLSLETGLYTFENRTVRVKYPGTYRVYPQINHQYEVEAVDPEHIGELVE